MRSKKTKNSKKDNNTLVEKIAETSLNTEYYGNFRMFEFNELNSANEILVLMIGNPNEFKAPLVRIHSRCLTGEVFRSLQCDCAQQLEKALDLIKAEGEGIIIYLDQEGRGLGLAVKIKAYELYEKEGIDTVDAYLGMDLPIDQRNYNGAIGILRYFRINKVRLLTNNPDKMNALKENGINVERIALEIPPSQWTKNYLQTKKTRMGHLLKYL